MRVLLLGYSSIARRRVLPALARLGGGEVEVATHTRRAELDAQEGAASPPIARVYDDYGDALASGRADLVYVSCVNNEHARWVRAALEAGCHVVVDKPACCDLATAEQLVALARRQDRCLAEATVYGYHPQFDALRRALGPGGARRLTATLSFPPLAAKDFRYRAAQGGGALWDLGPYAVTPGRLLFGREPEDMRVVITGRGEEVETAFSLLADYGDGHTLVGHFGFDTAYRNRLEVLGPEVAVALERAFTTPAEMQNELVITRSGGSEKEAIASADSFALFLAAVQHAIETKRYAGFAEDLLCDARALARLRKCAGSGKRGRGEGAE